LCNEYCKQTQEVYHNILKLEVTNNNEYNCNYLDLEITIHNDKISTKMYNKTDSFNFSIKKFPNYNTNISYHIKFNTIYAEILRTTLEYTLKQLIESGYNTNIFISSLMKCLIKNPSITYKFNL
ncbi:hypothetical protein COOONC_09517, partial [Cooperia oncophora]